MIFRAQGSVTIPAKPRTVGGLIGWARGVNRTLQELRDRKVVGHAPKRAGTKATAPFHVSLLTPEPETYEVTVGWGYVNERIPGPDGAIELHEPANMYEEVDPPTDPKTFTDKLRTLPISVGQAVYIKVNVTADGIVGQPAEVPSDPPGGPPTQEDAVIIEVGSDNETSSHYEPKADDETQDGAAGYYYYKLAVLKAPVAPSTTPTLKKWLTGSHIDHIQELPKIKSMQLPGVGIGCVTKDYNPSTNAYRFRSINANLGKNTITTNGDFIEVRGTKKDANLKRRVGDGSLEDFLAWSDGYMTTGADVIGDEDPPVDPSELILNIPTVKSRDTTPQVNVSVVGGFANVYEVTGNTKDGTLTYSIGGASPEVVLQWVDGLITSEGDLNNIPIPAAGDYDATGNVIIGAESSVPYITVVDGLVTDIQDITIPVAGIAGAHHDWKVTDLGLVGDPGVQNYHVVGGTVYDPGGDITVADTTIASDVGEIVLKTTRHATNRALTVGVIEFQSTVPDSDSTNQYRSLAYVNSGAPPTVRQNQFGEIRIMEDLIVVDDEFRFLVVDMAHRNLYAP